MIVCIQIGEKNPRTQSSHPCKRYLSDVDPFIYNPKQTYSPDAKWAGGKRKKLVFENIKKTFLIKKSRTLFAYDCITYLKLNFINSSNNYIN